MNRVLFFLILFFSIFVCRSVLLFADVMPRKVIAFYDPEEAVGDYFFTRLHQRAEMPLNHLGIELIPWSTKKNLPTKDDLKGVLGFVTWFNRASVFENPDPFCYWMDDQLHDGYRWVLLGHLGIYDAKTKILTSQCQQTLQTLGIQDRGHAATNPYYLEVVKKDSAMVEFERKLVFSEGIEYNDFKSLDPQAHVYLVVRRTDIKDTASDLVFVNKQGGFVAPTFVNYFVRDLDKCHWRINPFKFFEEAFGLKGMPRPDINTINGSRVFFSHIDGDGIMNISQTDQTSYAGEVLYEEVLKKYSDLPMTVSLITGYFDLPEYHTDQIKAIYKNIFALPNVEPASHGYAHPLVWKKGTLALTIPKYQYSADKEINGSVSLLNNILKESGVNKNISLFQWTGNCLPGGDAIRVLKDSKLLNINGGDSRFDERHDGYSWVAPIGILKEDVHQIYTAAPNENVFTNLWQGPYYGFKDVIQTYENTERPRRLKPINIYYHFYSAEKIAALNALKDVYDYIKTTDIVPIFTSQYAQMAQDFYGVKIDKKAEGIYTVSDNGLVKTIRFDDEKRALDLIHSQGVLGSKTMNGSLYVYLNEDSEHTITLSGTAIPQVSVLNASFQIEGLKANNKKIIFSKRGWYRENLKLVGLVADKNYVVSEDPQSWLVKSNQWGELNIDFKKIENGGAATKVEITLESF